MNDRLQLDVTAEDMAKTTLFRSVDVSLILTSLQSCQRRHLKAGETLIKMNEANKAMYVVLAGHLFVSLSSSDQLGVSVAVIGDCVGEMSVIDGRPATANVIAEVDSEVLVLPRELIWTLIDHTTLLSRNLLYILAGRLRLGDNIISANQRERAASQRYATQDLHTTLRNRRWFDETLPRFVDDAVAGSKPLALVMCEIANLERLSAQIGRTATDSIIERVARAVSQSVPDATHAARYSDGRFAILLPGCPYPASKNVCDAIHKALTGVPPLARETGPSVVPQLSLGLANFQAGMTAQQFEKSALLALEDPAEPAIA